MGLMDWLTGNKAPDPNIQRRSRDQLISDILALNDDARPWSVRDTRAEVPSAFAATLQSLGLTHQPDLIATWKRDDARWRQKLADTGMASGLAILLRLDDAESTVRSVDHVVEGGVTRSGTGFLLTGFRGQSMKTGYSKTIRRGDDGQWSTASEASLSTDDIKGPLRDAAARAGWGWRGVVAGRF